MANWVAVAPDYSVCVDMDIVGKIELSRLVDDIYSVVFLDRNAKEVVASYNFKGRSPALECCKNAYLAAGGIIPLAKLGVDHYGEAKESGSGTVRGEGWETRRSGESKSS